MKKIVILILILFGLSSIYVHAHPKKVAGFNPGLEVISTYKSNYFIAGDDNDQIKFQISFKYDLFYPNRWGIYFAYNQLSIWKLYSGFFTESNYNPEIFVRFESGYNFLNNLMIPFMDYIQIGIYEHDSNGEGDTSNNISIDRFYFQIQSSFMLFGFLNIGLNVKVWYFYKIGKYNDDITNYIGYFQLRPFIAILDNKGIHQEEVYCQFGIGKDLSKYWLEFGFMTRTLFSRARLYFQAHLGYFETLNTYNVVNNSRYKMSIRGGIIVN